MALDFFIPTGIVIFILYLKFNNMAKVLRKTQIIDYLIKNHNGTNIRYKDLTIAALMCKGDIKDPSQYNYYGMRGAFGTNFVSRTGYMRRPSKKEPRYISKYYNEKGQPRYQIIDSVTGQEVNKTNTTLLWLDDIRDPFTDNWIRDYAPRFIDRSSDIVWVKSYDEFTKWIKANGMPEMISFDHDLGEDVARAKVVKGLSKRQARMQKRETLSGFDCTKWLVDYCLDNDIKLTRWAVHSANPVGAKNISSLLINLEKHQQ